MFFIQAPPPPPAYQPITILVHGTRASSFIPLALSPTAQASLDTFSHCPLGLHKAATFKEDQHFRMLAHTLSTADPQQFPFDSLYIFGWSGDLDVKSRHADALIFHRALHNLITQHQNLHGAPPSITIITHSHGGNVALNLAAIDEPYQICIDRLILLACPVQDETARFVENPCFKKIYAPHSHDDLIQILDPQRLQPLKEGMQNCQKTHLLSALEILKNACSHAQAKPLFSERHFPSKKVIHIALTWTNALITHTDIECFGQAGKIFLQLNNSFKTSARGLFHGEFIMPSFIKKIPFIIAMADRSISATSAQNSDIMIAL